MTTVTSAHPVDLSRHMFSSSTSSSSLERTVSASSSTTVHPLDSTLAKEEKASSSSSSSSPTFQSNSPSSMHQTISTAESSINTAESLSPPLPSVSQSSRKHEKSAASATSATPHVTSPDALNSGDYSWDAGNGKGADNADDRNEAGQTRRRRDQWSYDSSQDNDEMYSSLMEEEMPMQYPPISKEDQEARVIEMNLERWASEEKLRRKAHRTSRIGSGSNPLVAPGLVSKRRSVLGLLSNGRSGSGGMVSLQQQADASGNTKRDSRREWNVSKDDESSDYGGTTPIKSPIDITEDRQSEDMKLVKGKAREGSDPFRDPSSTTNNPSAKRMSTIKPTPRAPIVTPGSAPTIRHRANERLLKEGGTLQMPSIVATDDDEEREAVRHLQELVIDPFQSAAEVDQQHRYLLARDAAKKTILNGDDGKGIVTAAPRPIMPPIRKSMSSSKFNEIGLENEENTLADDWLRENSANDQAGEERKSWWTEWLCGCEGLEEEEDQQTGRTMPG